MSRINLSVNRLSVASFRRGHRKVAGRQLFDRYYESIEFEAHETARFAFPCAFSESSLRLSSMKPTCRTAIDQACSLIARSVQFCPFMFQLSADACSLKGERFSKRSPIVREGRGLGQAKTKSTLNRSGQPAWFDDAASLSIPRHPPIRLPPPTIWTPAASSAHRMTSRRQALISAPYGRNADVGAASRRLGDR